MEFTYCNDIFPQEAITRKNKIYAILQPLSTTQGWRVKPPITITVGSKGVIHKNNYHQPQRTQNPQPQNSQTNGNLLTNIYLISNTHRPKQKETKRKNQKQQINSPILVE